MIDLTNELAQLLAYTGKVAVAIRKNASNKNNFYQDNTKNSVFWLSDSIHNIGVLHKAIQNNNILEIITICETYIEDFQKYFKNGTHNQHDPGPVFIEHKDIFTLNEGINIFEAIKEKCIKADLTNLPL